MHVLELTYWNDAPERTRTDVLNLLQRAQETANLQLHRCRAEQAVLTAVVAAFFTPHPRRVTFCLEALDTFSLTGPPWRTDG